MCSIPTALSEQDPRHMSVILNLNWFILGGFAAGCAWLLAALILGIKIVGLPWAMAAGRTSIAMAPVGKTVVPA